MVILPWFVLSFLFILTRAFSVSRHPSDGIPDAPTCEELQEFWEMFSQSVRMEETETNEIPIMAPPPVNAVLDRILTGSFGKGRHEKLHRKYAKAALPNHREFIDTLTKDSWLAMLPFSPDSLLLTKSQLPSGLVMPEGDGYFGEFHEASAAANVPGQRQTEPVISGFGSAHTSVPLGDRKNIDREYYIPQWGSPEDVDTFGNFLDYDIGSPQLAVTRTPKDTKGQWSDLPRGITNRKSFQVACDDLMNSACTENEQCLCKGWKNLHCIHGKCLKYDLKSDIIGKYGKWHDGPIPQLQLRLLAMPRKKNYKSIFM